jgi:hypothetical protein
MGANGLDPDYINYRVVDFGVTDLDDMSAALGRLALRVVVAGSVTPVGSGTSARHRVTITNAGIYVRDSYDFNGTQFLGYWDASDDSVSMVNPFSGDRIANEDFRNWRTATGRGGDYLVYSDVKWEALSTPDSFEI